MSMNLHLSYTPIVDTQIDPDFKPYVVHFDLYQTPTEVTFRLLNLGDNRRILEGYVEWTRQFEDPDTDEGFDSPSEYHRKELDRFVRTFGIDNVEFFAC